MTTKPNTKPSKPQSEPENLLDVAAAIAASNKPDVAIPAVVNEPTPTDETPTPGNNNGNNQIAESEPIKIPTASDTLAEQRAAAQAVLDKLDNQQNDADVIDVVIAMLNKSEDELLAVAVKSVGRMEFYIQCDSSQEVGRQFRYAVSTPSGKTTIVTQPTGSNNGSVRNWFKTITNPNGDTFEVPMKSPTTMDLDWLGEKLGLNFKKDATGKYSLSHATKQKMLDEAKWTYTNNQ